MKIDIHFPSDGGVIAFCHELKRASFGYPSSTIEEWARNKPEKAMRHWKKELLWPWFPTQCMPTNFTNA